MKVKYNILLLLMVLAITMFGCGDYEPPQKYLSINSREYDIETALIQDFGTDIDISFRNYVLSFRTSEVYPSTYITFDIYSYETTDLSDGDYDFSLDEGPGLFSFVEVGQSIEYDNVGVAISGKRYAESNSEFSGNIHVSIKGSKYHFIFDIEALQNGSITSITGEYEGYLTDGIIY